MQGIQQITSMGTLQLDKAEKDLAAGEFTYKLNMESGVNNKGQGLGRNAGKGTPLHCNRLLYVPLPAGVNTELNTFHSVQTNETYVAFHNSQGNHGFYRIKHETLQTEIVLIDPKLAFSLIARYKPRLQMFFNHNSFIEKKNKIFRKYLVFTDGLNWQGFLDVETAVATNGFRVAYFNTADRTQLWQLPTRPPLDCIQASWLAPDPGERSLENRMDDLTWQYRAQYIYTDGRPTGYGPISTMDMQQTSPCQKNAIGRPRCQKLIIPVGGPQVEKIVLLYRNCAGNTVDEQTSDWFQTDIIDKYEKCLDSDTPFYERQIRSDMGYNETTNTFEYVFCNTKQCIPVGRSQTDQNFIPCPITSYALALLDDRLMLNNNLKGYDPIACESLSKLSFNITEPLLAQCKIEMVTVKFRVIIHNHHLDQNEFLFNYENDTADNKYVLYFGGLGVGQGISSNFDDPGPYEQYIPDVEAGGFIVYVEGSSYYGVTKQYKRYKNGTVEYHRASNYQKGYIRNDKAQEIANKEYIIYQEGEVRVPKGTTGFLRVANHQARRTGNYQDTSTHIKGILRNLDAYQPYKYPLTTGNTDFFTTEIYFDTCGGAVDVSNTPFILTDLTLPGDFSQACVIAGYLRDKDGRPVEGAKCRVFGTTADHYVSDRTDHNGYYFFSARVAGGILGTISFGTDKMGVEFLLEKQGCTSEYAAEGYVGSGVRPGALLVRNPVINIPNYENDFYSIVRVLVQDVDNIPIPGVYVALEGRKARQTAADGIATLFVRNNMLTYGTAMSLRYMIMQNGLCYLTTGDCQACMPAGVIDFIACFDSIPVITLSNLAKFNKSTPLRGLRPGTYPAAVKFIDAAGRESFAQGDYTINLPSLQEKQAFSFSIVNWVVAGSMQLPSWVRKMAILLADNRNDDLIVSFVPDKVEFTDSVGNDATNLSAEKVKISSKALYDYYNKYSSVTNVKYGFLPGDVLQIVADQNGNLMTDPIDSLTFLIEGEESNLTDPEPETVPGETAVPIERFQRLVVSYSDVWKNIEAGFLFQILRPRICANSERYFEVCPLIDVVDGEPVVTTGTVNTFNSYFVRRQIVYDKKVNSFTFPFLHHSPSDFWGDHCIDRGRFSVKNPYEKSIQFGRNGMISDVWLENGNLNGLSTFRAELSKDFPGLQRGDIVMAIFQEGIIMMVSEYDYFIIRVGDDFARVGSDGILRALAADQVVSGPQSKIFGNFGCQYDDVGTILAGEGFVTWLDTSRGAWVLSDYNSAKDITQGRVSSYFTKKLQHKFQYNRYTQNPITATMGINPVTGTLMCTFFSRGRASDAENYVHSRDHIVYEENETMFYNPVSDGFKGFASFTPEGYGLIANGPTGKLFLAFRNGLPYLHQEMGISKYNEFFGVACDQFFEFVINRFKNNIKKYLAMEMQSHQKYYARMITTYDEDRQQVSRIVPDRVQKRAGGKWNTEFLCDENSIGGLYEGEMLRGYSMKVLLVKDNTVGSAVGTVDIQKQTVYNELDNILVKFMFSESSGFGEPQE